MEEADYKIIWVCNVTAITLLLLLLYLHTCLFIFLCVTTADFQIGFHFMDMIGFFKYFSINIHFFGEVFPSKFVSKMNGILMTQ